MSAHTPGPWSWIDGDGNEGTLSAPSGKVIDSAPYEGMFFSSDGDVTANQALIAAAPELLQALEMLLRRRMAVAKKIGAGDADGSDGRYAVARNAIAKARGLA